MPGSKKALLLTNGTHAPRGNNQALLEEILGEQAGLNIHALADPIGLTPERVGALDLIVDYSGNPEVEPTDEALETVLSAVERGLPYLALHVSSLPFIGQRPLEYLGERV